jgi:hypothetical protein
MNFLTLTAGPPAPSPTHQVKFNPGHYLQGDKQFGGVSVAYAQILQSTGTNGTTYPGSPFIGFQAYYSWGDLDPGPSLSANNNIAQLAADFNTLQQYCPGARFCPVIMHGRSTADTPGTGGFSKTQLPFTLPSDVYSNSSLYGAGPSGSAYSGCGFSGYYSDTNTFQIMSAAIWRSAVITRFLAFFQAVASYSFLTTYGPYAGQTFTFDTHPLIEAFFDGMENSYDFFVGGGQSGDWTASAQDACYQQEMTGLASAFPHTQVATFQSYGNNTTFPDPLLPGVIANAASNRNALSNADVYGVGIDVSAQHIYVGHTWNGSAWVAGGTDYRGQMAYLATIQPSDYSQNTGTSSSLAQTIANIYSTCQTLNATHILWTLWDEQTGTAESFSTNYLLPFAKANPVPNTSYPGNYP